VIVTRSHPIPGPLPELTAIEGALRYVPNQFTRFHTSLDGTSRSTSPSSARRPGDPAQEGEEVFGIGRRERTEDFSSPMKWRVPSACARRICAHLPGEVARRWTSRGVRFPGGIGSTGESQRHPCIHPDAAREAIAYLCCPATHGVLLYKYLGYDPRHAELSPGPSCSIWRSRNCFGTGHSERLTSPKGRRAQEVLWDARDDVREHMLLPTDA